MSDSPPVLIDRLRDRRPHIPATVMLVAMNCAAFAALLLAGAGLWHAPNDIQLSWGANFGPATKDGEWWRLATAMFLHFGLLHLAVNMFALVEAGRFVERILGPWRFLLLYCGSGLAGNLLSLATHGDRGISGGASGAVFGVYAALLILLWRERQRIARTEFRWLFWGGLGFTLANIAFGLMVTGIDNGAHIGGLLFGLCAAVALVRAQLDGTALPRPPRIAAAALLAGCCTVLVWLIPAPSYDWSDELTARGEISQFVSADADISSRWDAIIAQGRREGLSFEELAARIEHQVADRYEASFEQLAAMQIDPHVPSGRTLDLLKRYAELRRDASSEMVDALRTRDAQRLRQAIEKARTAGVVAGAGTAASAQPADSRDGAQR